MQNLLDEILTRVGGLQGAARAELEKEAKARPIWIPNPGPQTDAVNTQADELFYGGQAGGGKTDLSIGLALTSHERSLILRRVNKDALKLVPRIEEILGGRDGYNGQLQRWRVGDRLIEIAGCEQESDKQRFKGDPHDLIVFDEGTDFLESQFRFIIAWNRSARPGQRCRVVVASNPPTTPEGLWVIQYWAPWLDPTHPNPAGPGELRWFTTIDGVDTEMDGPGPHLVPGEAKPVLARSRTYLPAKLADNPDLAQTNYDSVLAALPDALRRAYRQGDFSAGLKDDDYQVIPTAWIIAAQERWKDDGWKPFGMTSMAIDCAGGGSDAQVIAFRHGGWYAPLRVDTGEMTKDPSLAFGYIMARRRDAAPVVVDVGGGYGGAIVDRLKANGIAHIGFNGAERSSKRERGSNIPYANKRAEAYFLLRDELNPDQEGGSVIALPPDTELRADLAAARYEPRALQIRGVYQIESKDEMRKRLGRSPDKADAVAMCLSEGRAAARRNYGATGQRPQVQMGYPDVRRGRQHANASGTGAPPWRQ